MENIPLGKQLYNAWLITGKTQEQAAKEIGCDESILRYIEPNDKRSQTRIRFKIEEYIQRVLTFTIKV